MIPYETWVKSSMGGKFNLNAVSEFQTSVVFEGKGRFSADHTLHMLLLAKNEKNSIYVIRKAKSSTTAMSHHYN